MKTKRSTIIRASIALAAIGVTVLEAACCFLCRTKILTPKGSRNIEEISVGDEVYSFDVDTHQVVVRPVSHVLRAQATEFFQIVAGESTISGVTGEHPFYDAQRKEWVAARDIVVGMRVLVWQENANPREIEITEVHRSTVTNPVEVYNLTVDGPEHNYFAEGLLVHNKIIINDDWCKNDPDGDGVACDCDEGDPTISEDAPENCADYVDNDCDGSVDEDDSECANVSPAGYPAWAKRFGDGSKQQGKAIVRVPNNYVVTGEFEGAVDWGFGPMTSAGEPDVFVMKMDPGGDPIWATRFGGPMADHVHALRSVGERTYVVGDFRGTVDFGFGPVTSSGGSDIFVISYNDDGSVAWVKTYGGAGEDRGTGLIVEPLAYPTVEVIIAGEFENSIDFGLGPLTSMGGKDVFVVRLDESLEPTWQKSYGTPSDDLKPEIATYSNNNLILGATFPNAFLAVGIAQTYGTENFVNTYNTGGGELNAAVDEYFGILLGGSFKDFADFGAGQLVTDDPGTDAFVIQLNDDGSTAWSRSYGGPGDQKINALSETDGYEFVIAGTNDGTLDLNGAILDAKQAPSGFVAAIDPTGMHIWSHTISSAGYTNNAVQGIAYVQTEQAVLATGSVDGPINLGVVSSKGDNMDVLVARFHW